MRRTVTLAVATLLALGLLAAPASADGHLATVNVIHGVPGLTVDVCAGAAGGELGVVAPGFEYKGIATLQLPAGSYDATVVAAGDSCDNAILSASGLPVTGGDNVDVVAHLLEGGAPTLSVFANSTKRFRPGRVLLDVRHAADAPATDIWVDKQKFELDTARRLFAGVTSGNGGSKRLTRGWWSVAVTPAGTTTPVIGPAALNLTPKKNWIVYAVGSLEGGLDVIVHAVDQG